MNVIRFLSLVLFALGLSACGNIQPDPYGSGPYYRPTVAPDRLNYRVETMPQRSYAATLNPDRTWTVNMNAPLASAQAPEGQYVAYRGHDKMWRINGRPVPDRLVVMSHRPQGFDGVYQFQMSGQPGSGAPAPLLAGIGAESAAMLLRELEAGGNPCTAKNHNSSVTVGSVIGGLGLGLLTMDLRGLVAGVLIGASGGSAEAKWNCTAFTRMRMEFLAVIDAAKARCKSTLSQREEGGKLVQDTKTKECAAVEATDFERIGQVRPQAAAPAASAPRRATPPAARQWDGTGTPPSWVK